VNTPKTYLILLLALTTVGGAALAWRQYGELVELRASAMNRDERADLQKRLWDLEKLNRELQDQMAARRGAGDDNGMESLLAAVPGGDGNEEDRRRKGDRDGRKGGNDPRQQFAAMQALMSKPEVQALLNLQQKAAIEQRYAALFKSLNLTAEQAGQLTSLLAERGNTRRDVAEAARTAGIDPRENPQAYRKLFADAQNELNNGIKAVIGEQGYAQYQNFEKTLPQRALVDSLQQRLSYSAAPLTPTQADQLVQILAANQPPRPAPGAGSQPGQPPARGPGGGDFVFDRGGPPGGFDGRASELMIGAVGGPGMGAIFGSDMGRGPGGPTVTAAAVAQAQAVLAPSQIAVLQQIQQQQQSQQQLQQLVRDTLAANQPAGPSGTAAPGSPPPTKLRRGPGG
jgi:hypothetical protein